MPDERWQSGFTHYPLAGGTGTEILTWLDDHSRYVLSVTAHGRVRTDRIEAGLEDGLDPAGTSRNRGRRFRPLPAR